MVRAAPFALPRNSRKTERAARQFFCGARRALCASEEFAQNGARREAVLLWCAPRPLRFRGIRAKRCAPRGSSFVVRAAPFALPSSPLRSLGRRRSRDHLRMIQRGDQRDAAQHIADQRREHVAANG